MRGNQVDEDVAVELNRRVIAAWRKVTDCPRAFEAREVEVVVRSANQKLCQPGWVSTVILGDSALVLAPDELVRKQVRASMGATPLRDVASEAWWKDAVDAAETMGPAVLGYADAATITLDLSSGVSQSTLDDPGVEAVMYRTGQDELMDSGIGYLTSPIFVLREHGDVLAMAGYRSWSGAFAHLGLLTAPEYRGRGYGRRVASAAAAHALGRGMLLQWRSKPRKTPGLAVELGFREFGRQLNVRLPARTGR